VKSELSNEVTEPGDIAHDVECEDLFLHYFISRS
jgi:hypothetical protein